MLFHHKTIRPIKREQGVVIIMALFVVAIVAAISYAMLIRSTRDTERTLMILRNTEAEFYAQGGIMWAMDVLSSNLEKQKSNTNQRIDYLPISSPVNHLNEYEISTTIYDLQGRFNLNSLDKPKQIDAFRRLLKAVNPNITDEKSLEIANALKDWITASNNNTPNEIEKYYLNLKTPYRAAHHPMAHVSELRLVKGMNSSLYQALLPYVSALPSGTLINMTSADAKVILTLSPSITYDAAKSLQDLIASQKIATKEALLKLDMIRNMQLAMEDIDINTSYFLVETVVSIENQRIVIYTVLQRALKNGRPVFRILSQSKGMM